MEKREKSSRIPIFFIFIIFLIWVLLQFFAPVAVEKGSVKDLSGSTALFDNKQTIKNMSFPWGAVYESGDRLCHQKADRSFFINDNQMPFCSRCLAIFLGLTIGLGFMIFIKIKLDEKFAFILIVSLIPIGIDGVGQLFGLWESVNLIRVATGLFVGIMCGIAIGIIVDELSDMIKMRKTKTN
jgi:uncharacterized membrane protein